MAATRNIASAPSFAGVIADCTAKAMKKRASVSPRDKRRGRATPPTQYGIFKKDNVLSLENEGQPSGPRNKEGTNRLSTKGEKR